MPTAKKAPKGCAKATRCKPKRKLSDNMLQDFVQHKTSVLIIMAAALSLGALFSMMLGVSAAQF